MTVYRRAAKRDQNEAIIVEALEKAGCLVKRSADGDWDLVTVRIHGGGVGARVYLMDVKNPEDGHRDKRTTNQRKSVDAGWPIHFVETPEDALRVVGAL